MTGAVKRQGFFDLDRIVVPRSLADAANDHLRAAGRKGCEGFALWAGRRDGDTFLVDETVIPAQTGIRSEEGVCVTVDGDELFRLNVHLFEQGRLLVAQLHSHPTDAYHSETDDAYPIATTAGALSLVIPDFAIRPFSLSECAIYRLSPDGLWQELDFETVERLIEIVENS